MMAVLRAFMPALAVPLVALGAASLAHANPQSKLTDDVSGAIRGSVFDTQTSLPLREAAVRLFGREFSRQTTADGDGQFEFEEVPPGDYLITAVSPGYATAASGQRTPAHAPRSFPLRARQTLTEADLHLTPLGKISGEIVDESGKPVAGASISVVRQPGNNADRRPPGALTMQAITDAQGRYLVNGLAAGSYYVLAVRSPGNTDQSMPAFFQLPARTLYPGTTVPALAQAVRVDLGSETANISFALQPAKLSRVAGTVVDASGRPFDDGVVLINPASSELSNLSSGLLYSEVDSDGRFVIKGVAPGLYTLDVRNKSAFEAIAVTGGSVDSVRQGSREFATESLRVDNEDIDNLIVRTQPGFAIAGKIVALGLPARALEGIELTAFSTAQASQFSRFLVGGTARAEADGSFELRKLFGPQVIRTSRLPAGWALKSIRIGGIDAADAGVDISHDWSGVEVVIARQSELAGRVTDRRGMFIAGATIVVFAEDSGRRTAPQTRYIRSTLTNETGAFTITGLPVGRYYGVALPAVIPGQTSDPDDLEALVPRATRFSIGEGEQRPLELRIE